MGKTSKENLKKQSRIFPVSYTHLVLVMIMRGPHTYTGEDTVEIDCHGGVYAMKKVLETVLKNGAVIAEPGEFTKRAFLNGRLDLSQAEAVMDVIQAKNSMALKSSVEQLKGSVQRAVKAVSYTHLSSLSGLILTDVNW